MQGPLKVDKVYVVHVSTDVQREEHMRKELDKFGIPFEFMLKGDRDDLTAEIIEEYFVGEEIGGMPATAQQSCSYKHLAIYEKMLEDKVSDALIFEDDIYLSDKFIAVFNKTIDQLKSLGEEKQNKALINFESSTRKVIPPSQREDGQYLYKADRSRCAGAYYLKVQLASEIVDHRKEFKCNKPIDWYHNELIGEINLQHYWCHPPVVEQGSHNGKMQSRIDDKKYGLVRQVTWKLSSWYKQKIRPLLGGKN